MHNRTRQLRRGILLVTVLLLLSATDALALVPAEEQAAGTATDPLIDVISHTLEELNTFHGRIQREIQRELELIGLRADHTVLGEAILSPIKVTRLYEQRLYRPVWITLSGPHQQAYALLRALREAPKEGLDPGEYHLERIKDLMARVVRLWENKQALSPMRLAMLDVLLTDAFVSYGSHLCCGRIDPESIEHYAFDGRGETGLAALLQEGLDSGTLDEVLEGLAPQHAGYAELRSALARYRELALDGGWPQVGEGPSLKPGDTGERVEALRKRLTVSGELAGPPDTETDTFDEPLEAAVKAFQEDHGLTTDGVVGKDTLAALNVPIENRLEQIELNMERWRWLPRTLGERYILVDIASFELDVVEDGQTVMSMEAIVGTGYRSTPSFSGTLSYLVLGPYWNVPHTIAVEDKLPLIQSDIQFLKRNEYKVFSGWRDNEEEVDPASIDWSSLSEDYFPYRLRKDPGPNNPLGRVKFMFPNKFDVYLHDTPEKELFKKTVRTFSSGCIRISKPLELAIYLLKDAPGWDRRAILRGIIKWKAQAVRIPQSVPIHLVYFTAWAREDGTLEFRPDVYERDEGLSNALHIGIHH